MHRHLHPHPTGPRAAIVPARALLLAGALLLSAVAPANGATAAADTARSATPIVVASPAMQPLLDLARQARDLEDFGLYDSAGVVLDRLRGRARPDPDLDLALAIDRARAGQLDAARALLDGPALRAAAFDSTPPARRRPYGPRREESWFGGRFEGWTWTAARARAEVLARVGDWTGARRAARAALRERPLAGTDWLVVAVCSARLGDLEAAEREARTAARLDPMLPEAHYLVGLFDWRGGRRAATLERCAAAIALDSLYAPAIRARQRLRFFPGAAPDTFPTAFLTGLRAADLLTSPDRPKIEDDQHLDQNAVVVQRTMVPIPDSLQIEIPPLRLVLPVLVDADGRAVLCHLPWIAPGDLPGPLVGILLESLPLWRFSPARRFGRPVASWAGVTISTGTR
jgi:hypothetical protein